MEPWHQIIVVKRLLEHLQRRSYPQREIWHSGTSKLYFRVKSPGCHSRSCKNEILHFSRNSHDWDKLRCLLCHVGVYHRICSTCAAAAKSLQSCPTLCDPIDSSPQAPPSLGFSRQEHWSGLPFPSPMRESQSESEVAQSCPTLSDPMDCSPPGPSVHGIFQARVLEWVVI